MHLRSTIKAGVQEPIQTILPASILKFVDLINLGMLEGDWKLALIYFLKPGPWEFKHTSQSPWS